MISAHIPVQDLKLGETYAGFELKESGQLDSVKACYYLFEHIKTGAQLMHLHNTDENNLFAIGFKTPPQDNTGVAHILEHSVLGGSRKFKVKDPFNEMAKGSMSTFINAFTFPDKTVYPVSSKIPKDFFHLVEVYLDAVLFPNLTELTFGQEGHHFEFAEPENDQSELTIKGIVYNEMKGVYSNLDSVVGETSFRKLFPDTIYGNDSGGNPEAIPDLTYENFKNFHDEYYHPSNARIYISGNIPTVEILEFIDGEYLNQFEKRSVNSDIGLQNRWDKSRRLSFDFPAQQGEEEQYAITRNWLTNPILEPQETVAMMIVEDIILGNSAAVLRKTLIDSGLGSALTPGAGYATETQETFFSVGLKGVKKADLSKVEDLIQSTLEKIAQDGFSDLELERAFHQIEFHNSEIKGGGIPFDITLMITAFQSWLYDGHPGMYLDLRPYIKEIQAELKKNPNYLVEVFKRNLLDNEHNITIEFTPNLSFVQEKESKLRAKLDTIQGGLSGDDKKNLIDFAKKLLQEQQRPNSPEELATLPAIQVGDIPVEIEKVAAERFDKNGIDFYHNELFTNGVQYMELYFDLSDIDDSLLQYIPLFCLILSGCGFDAGLYEGEAATDAKDWSSPDARPVIPFDELANIKSLKTGGLGAHFLLTPKVTDPSDIVVGLSLGGKVLPRNFEAMLSILRGLLLYPDFADLKRIREILVQQQAALKSSLVPNGLRYAWGHGAGKINRASYAKEYWSGLRYVSFLDQVLEPDNFKQLPGKLLKLRELIFNPDRFRVHTIGDKNFTADNNLKLIESNLKQSLENLPQPKDGTIADSGVSFFGNFVAAGQSTEKHDYVGIALEAEVSYATMVFATCAYDHEAAPYFYFLQNYLSSGFLNDRIRIQSGAYGGFASYFGTEGMMGFGSYRDPNIINTVKTFHDCMALLKAGEFDDEEVGRALIGAMSGLDRPLTPAAAGNSSFLRHLSGNSDELRQRFRKELLGLTTDKLKAAIAPVLAANNYYAYSIVASKSKLEELQSELKIPDMQIKTVDQISSNFV